MSKVVTLRLDEQLYRLFRHCAQADNRALSNFIETAVKRYVEENEFAEPFETDAIASDERLNRSLQQGHKDAKAKKGRWVA